MVENDHLTELRKLQQDRLYLSYAEGVSKPRFHSENASNVFIHTSRGEFKNAIINDYFRYAFEENLQKEIKSYENRVHIVFEKRRFQIVFCPCGNEFEKPAFEIPSVSRAFTKSSVFVTDSVDGRPNCKNKAVFSHFCGVVS